DDRRGGSSRAYNVGLLLTLPELGGVRPFERLLAGASRVDDAATEKTRPPRRQRSDPPIDVVSGSRGYRHHAEADIDDCDPIEIREPVQHDSAGVIVGASEDEIAGFERVAHI